MEKLTLTPNIPQQIALKFPDGKLVEGRFGDQMMYSLANNQVMYLDTDVAAKINALELRKNEPFWICKRWTGKKGDQIQWDIYRLDGNSPAVTTGLAPTAIESQIAAQRQQPIPPMPAAPTVDRVVFANGSGTGVVAPAPATAVSQPPSFTNGNGNKPVNGNGTPPNGSQPYEAAGILAPPIKIGYDVALRRILRVTIAELKAAGEQWSDAARQDLVSTLMIQAARDGVITWLPLTREEGN
ncbi:MAG: hypothetical protein ABSH49_26465 [Bryobacteraceae bacterium]|jgi:hypothetical protein